MKREAADARVLTRLPLRIDSWAIVHVRARKSVVAASGDRRLLWGRAAETPAKNKAVPQPVDTEIRFHSVVRKSKSLPLLRPPERTTFVSEINRLAAQWTA
jgi:hypothetical protein